MSAEDLASKNYNKNEIDSAILNQLLVHQKLEKITSEQKRTENPESAGAWIRWSVFIMLGIVGAVCILVFLQSYGFLPKYNDEQHYKARLTEITSTFNQCLKDRRALNEKLHADKQLPIFNEHYYTPMLAQLNYSDSRCKIKDDKLDRCEDKLETQRQENYNLKEELLAVKEQLATLKSQLNALVVQSEAEGDKCEGWLCSGVKLLYNAMKDTTATKNEVNS